MTVSTHEPITSTRAIISSLTHDTPLSQTIEECKKVTQNDDDDSSNHLDSLPITKSSPTHLNIDIVKHKNCLDICSNFEFNMNMNDNKTKVQNPLIEELSEFNANSSLPNTEVKLNDDFGSNGTNGMIDDVVIDTTVDEQKITKQLTNSCCFDDNPEINTKHAIKSTAITFYCESLDGSKPTAEDIDTAEEI